MQVTERRDVLEDLAVAKHTSVPTAGYPTTRRKRCLLSLRYALLIPADVQCVISCCVRSRTTFSTRSPHCVAHTHLHILLRMDSLINPLILEHTD